MIRTTKFLIICNDYLNEWGAFHSLNSKRSVKRIKTIMIVYKIVYQWIQNKKGVIQHYDGHDDYYQLLLILQNIPRLLT